MKALKLTIYPLLEKVGRNARPGYIVGKRGVSISEAHRTGIAKRLTDPELAAERWHFDFEDFDRTMRADPDDLSQEEWDAYIERRIEAEAALHRFATLPHYDEDQS